MDQTDRRTTRADDRWVIGPKLTIIGSFYDSGGFWGVLIGMFFLGFATRALDRLLAAGKTDLGRALGIIWMSQIWIMFASSDSWTLGSMFATGLPWFVLWITVKVQRHGIVGRTDDRVRGGPRHAHS